MTCPGCSSPTSGLYVGGCRGCLVRMIAQGPHFFASLRRGRLTPEYVAALRELGDDIDAAHAEVKALAKTIHMGSCPA